MALIHWWPLNGNLNDFGTKTATLVNGGATVNTAGKIGNCYSFDGNDDCISISSQSLFDCFKGGSTPFSITMWIYNNESSGARGVLFGDYGTTGVINFNIEINTGSVSNNSIRFYWGNSPDWNANSSIVSPNKWTHLSVIYDGTSIKVYIDGVLTNTRNGTLVSRSKTSGNFLLGRDGRTGATAFNGRLNDVRVYDHALSAKEVKEIAKGLVLHYNFEDPWIEPTMNLITSINGSSLLVKAGNGIDVQTASGDAACGLVLSTTAVAGNTYTLSFDVSGMGSSDRCSFGIWFSGGVGQKYITPIYNGHNVIKCANFPAAVSSLTFDDSGRSNTNIIHIRNFQFEAKDHATPYVVGTRSVGTVYDNSGYGYDGTAFPDGTTGSLPITTDSGSGTYSVYLSYNNTAIQTPDLSTLIHDGNYSIACWFKHTNDWSGRSWETIYGGPSGFEIEMKNSTTNSPLLYAYSWNKGSVAYSLNEWHQFVMTRTTSGTVWYLDGVQAFTGTAGNIPSGDYFIGAWKTNAQQNYRGYVADFKIYATALSANDILAEYQRKAAIDKSGNMFTGEFIETGTFPKVNKNNTITVEELTETANSNAKLFEDSIVSSEFYEL